MSDPIGLIAGSGSFPILFAREAKRQGLRVVAIALKGVTDPALAGIVDACHTFKLGQVSGPLKTLKAAGVRRAVMAGKVQHVSLFGGVLPDLRAVKLLAGLKDKRTDTILGALAGEFEREGITLLSSATYLSHLLPRAGLLSRRSPSERELADARLGWRAAKALAGVDAGQCALVQGGAVVALEAMEGTDAAVERAAALARSFGREAGLVVVKVAKPRQDFRFDLPVLGLDTLRVFERCRVRALALEAEKTLLLEREAFLDRADELDLAVWAATEESWPGEDA